jgi:hypothetical protein
MLMTGGAVGPDEVLFTRPVVPPTATTELVAAGPGVSGLGADIEPKEALSGDFEAY